jgi:hypothetical protein
MASGLGQRRKRAAVPEPGTRVWVNAWREAEAPSEALTCAICMDVFVAVRAVSRPRQGPWPAAAAARQRRKRLRAPDDTAAA